MQDPAQCGYCSDVLLPSSGHLRVTVSPARLTVEYVKAYLEKDETADRMNGGIAWAYTIKAKATARVVRRHLRGAP
jgi:hypothetical protein